MAKMRRQARPTDQPATLDMFDRVRNETGVKLSTGIAGGCGNYLGRLEDGSWLYVTDADEPMSGMHAHDLSLREAHEAEHGPLGWYVAIHPNEYDEEFERRHPGLGDAAATDPVHEHVDKEALTADLPRVIQRALSTMPHGQGSGDRAPDQGLDYEKLVNPRHDLDDDYGDIFGGGP